MAKFELTITGTFEAADDDEADREVAKFAKAIERLDVTIEDTGYVEVEYAMPETKVVEQFEAEILPGVIAEYGPNDKIAQREAFNNYTDMLCKDDVITDWQYENIDNPY